MKRALKKLVFVEPKSTHLHIYSRVCIPRLGSVLLGTLMRNQGYDVRVYIEDIEAPDMNEVMSADLVGISAITSTAPQSYRLADKVRAAGGIVVLGGTHTSFLPEEGLEHADFVIRGEPALERVASGAPGNAPAGIEFSRMRVEFLRSPGKFTVRDAVVRGPVVGATMDGVLDYGANEVRLRGTFVPLYGLNNMFGQIPIVGLLLGGGDKEGLVGITFEVVGPTGSPTLRVNPISAVAPGLLRKVFEFPSSVPGERYPDPRTSYADRDR